MEKLLNKNNNTIKRKTFNYKKKITIVYTTLSNIIGFIILCIATFLYLKSLKGCNGNEFSCINYSLKYIYDDIYYCMHSALYFLIFLFLIQIKICSIYQLLFFIIIISGLIYKDHDDSFSNHGILNLFALFIILLFGEIIILLFILLINLIKRKKYNSFLSIIIGIIIFLFLLYIKNIDKYNCKDWDKGLNNSYINNNISIYPCTINIPHKKCLIDIFSPLLDFSKVFHMKCEKRKEKEKTLLIEKSNLKNFKNIKKIGFPNTIGDIEEIKGEPAMYSDTLLKFVINNLINIKENNITNKLKEPEVIVDFTSDPYGKLNIRINYNEKLSLKRKKLSNNRYSNNILFIYLDNLSRVHFYRQYKKTSNFLKKFLTYEGFSIKDNWQKFHGFEFMKYHKFKGATLNNAIPMFSGVYFGWKNKMISIIRDLKNLGYITCNVQDICHKELMSIGKIKSYSYIEFDHEYAGPNCDPNIYSYGFGIFEGENAVFRKCLYGKESFEHSLEYAKQFWISYKKNKRFLRIVNTYAHEYSGEKSKYADNALFNFLNYLYDSNELLNTTVFLTGDHGFALMGIYKLLNSKDWKIEQFFPVFILLVPDLKNVSYNEQYSEILKNQQNLITAFDIYYTIRYIIYGEKYKDLPLNGNKNDGETLFKYINPKERICSKYKMIKNCQCIINK